MPLSEHEQRMLEQMEQALYAEDSKFAASFRGSELRRHKRRQLGLAVVGFVAGLALLMGSVASGTTNLVGVILGLAGFLVMLVSVMYVVSSSRKPTPLQVVTGDGEARPPRRPKRNRPGGSFMARVEERWRRRRESGY